MRMTHATDFFLLKAEKIEGKTFIGWSWQVTSPTTTFTLLTKQVISPFIAYGDIKYAHMPTSEPEVVLTANYTDGDTISVSGGNIVKVNGQICEPIDTITVPFRLDSFVVAPSVRSPYTFDSWDCHTVDGSYYHYTVSSEYDPALTITPSKQDIRTIQAQLVPKIYYKLTLYTCEITECTGFYYESNRQEDMPDYIHTYNIEKYSCFRISPTYSKDIDDYSTGFTIENNDTGTRTESNLGTIFMWYLRNNYTITTWLRKKGSSSNYPNSYEISIKNAYVDSVYTNDDSPAYALHKTSGINLTNHHWKLAQKSGTTVRPTLYPAEIPLYHRFKYWKIISTIYQKNKEPIITTNYVYTNILDKSLYSLR